jgi:hypothetical protein
MSQGLNTLREASPRRLPPSPSSRAPPSPVRLPFCRWRAARRSARLRSDVRGRYWCAVGRRTCSSGTSPSSSSCSPSEIATLLPRGCPLLPSAQTSLRATFGSPGAAPRRLGLLRWPKCSPLGAPTSSTGGSAATARPSRRARARGAAAGALVLLWEVLWEVLRKIPLFTHPLYGVVDRFETIVELEPRGGERGTSVVGDRTAHRQAVPAHGFSLTILSTFQFPLYGPHPPHALL